MLDIKITLDATSRLESSIYRLCEALERLGGSQPASQRETPAEKPRAPQKPKIVDRPKAANIAAAPAPAPAPVEKAPDPVPVAPEAPTFTREQVCKAGADLITAHPDRLGDLQQLLTGYGVRGVANVPEDRLGEFATALRGMGADI